MKNTDVALVILIAAVSVAISYFLGNAILGDPNDRVTTVDYMETISDTVEEPDVESFNPYTLNPTVEVYVGDCGAMEVWDSAAKKCRPIISEEDEDTAPTSANSEE
ncbi:hypothetical protein IKX12_01275 [Candidatus Saccharibacteria bacterium]|nr:hypothetical protein [Candidatus Saccharibacteria bacterium]